MFLEWVDVPLSGIVIFDIVTTSQETFGIRCEYFNQDAYSNVSLLDEGRDITIINFYGTYILMNLNSEGNKTEPLSIIVNRDTQKSLSERGTTEDLWLKCNLECFQFFSEGSYSLRCFQSDGEFTPDLQRQRKQVS